MDQRAVAINVGANTTLPGIRGRLFPDGSFEYIPIPEREPTARPVPTYDDLAVPVPAGIEDEPVHLDPSFAEYPCCDDYTYGDEHGVKAGPLSDLSTGDIVWFYATLEPIDDEPNWAPPEWGAFIIGQFTLEIEPVEPNTLETLESTYRQRVEANAHFKRAEPDARVVLVGDRTGSRLFDQALPLSTPAAGIEANDYVTELAGDSGRGPWWRRVMRFDTDATAKLRQAIKSKETQPGPRLQTDE